MKTSLVGFLAFGLSIIASHAQDSTATLLLQEEVAIFSKPTILSEFEAGIDADYEQKRMLNLGTGINPLNMGNSTGTLFISLDQKINLRNAFRVGFSTVGDFKAWGATFVEYRFYIDKNKKGNNFNGKYVGLGYARKFNFDRGDGNPHGSFVSWNGLLHYDRSTFSLSIGSRVGELLDYGLSLGLRSGKSTFVNETDNLLFDENSPNRLAPFLGTYFNFSLNLLKSQEDKNCNYMKCFEEVNKQWKIAINDLAYFDLQRQSGGIKLDYEHRLGASFFTMNYSIGGNVKRERQFESYYNESNNLNGGDNFFNVFNFRDNKVTDISASFISSVQLRHYLLKKKSIAKGKSIQNLNGLYGFLGIQGELSTLELPPSWVNSELVIENTYVSPSLGIGVQTKIGSRHFLDTSISYNPGSNEGVLGSFKFGFSR